MREFFSSKKFKVLVCVLVVIAGFMLGASRIPGFASIPSKALSYVTMPFRWVASAFSNAAEGFTSKFKNIDDLTEENARLQEELRALRKQLVDFDTYKAQNEQYKEFLELKENNPDYQFAAASVIGYDANDPFISFTIDKGSLDGVKYQDPVITPDGLVGKVIEVGPTYAKVMSVLNVSINAGVYNTRTREPSTIEGTATLSPEGRCKMVYLDRESDVKEGDTIVTSGVGGIFPKDLLVGKVVSVKSETHGISLYAEIEPFADLRHLSGVFVVTSFTGQGSGLQ